MNFPTSPLLSQLPLWRRLRDRLSTPRQPVSDADTVMAWPPTPGKLLDRDERLAHPALESALRIAHPQGFLLAHVPLPRLVRVPSRRSHKDWLARTAHVSVDFVLCDASSRPLVVVMMREAEESDSRQRRRERVARICEAAGIRLLSWPAGWKPEPKSLRELLFSSAAPEQIPAH